MQVIMSMFEAEHAIKLIIDKLGPGYHPDTPLSDYVTIGVPHIPSFTREELFVLEPMHTGACDVLGDQVYELALSYTKEKFGL